MMIALAVIGGLASLVFGIWLLVEAFKTSIGWGLVSLLVPFGAVVFAIKYWDRAKKPFLGSVAAGILYAVAIVPVMMQSMGEFQERAAAAQAQQQQAQEALEEAQASDSAE